MKEKFGQWCLVELMGHTRVAGYVTEEVIFGTPMARIDIPKGADTYTQWVGGQSIFRVTPISEAVARSFSANNSTAPIQVYELNLPQLTPVYADDEFPF